MSTAAYQIDERNFDYSGFESQQDYLRYSRDVEHKHSKGAQLILELCSTYVQRCEQAFAEGKNAVWTAGMWETPLIHACDAIPISFTEAGRLSSPDAVTIAEDRFQLPREACSMVKAAVGEWYLRRNKVTRVLASGTNCEPYGQAIEQLDAMGYDTHFLDIPPINRGRFNAREQAEFVKRIGDELRTAAEWFGGHKLDEDRLAFEVRRTNESFAKLRKILALRIQKPRFLKSLVTMYTIVGVGHYFGDPERYTQALDLLLEELEAAPVEQYGPTPDLVPIMWIGGRGQEFGVFKTLDDLNAATLGWWIPTPYLYDYEEEYGGLEALARYPLRVYNRGGNLFQRIDDLIEWLAAQNVTPKGAILYGYFGCSINSSELSRTYLAKKGINAFIVEGTFQVGPPSGQLITRLKAFLEVLS
ncbi:MAG TPA: 2-hydroxyacyl-CoA dehydratase family protein [Phototrophicaceae bacterium]|nr:2-hydroxyacyl-CoA dehydratase family protein [Phototrophicaceae bacterium]